MNLHRMGQPLRAATHPESQVVSDLQASPSLVFNLLLASVECSFGSTHRTQSHTFTEPHREAHVNERK